MDTNNDKKITAFHFEAESFFSEIVVSYSDLSLLFINSLPRLIILIAEMDATTNPETKRTLNIHLDGCPNINIIFNDHSTIIMYP